MLSPQVEIIKEDDSLSPESTNQLIRKKDKKRMELLSLESHTLTDGFRREIDSAARRIHTLIAKSGRPPLDVEIIQQNLSFENSILLEALKKLEKLKRIEWVDNSKVILSEQDRMMTLIYCLRKSFLNHLSKAAGCCFLYA
jgi:hypothetical protein